MYFVSQPIVTDGLVLNMDAGNTLSYTSGSSTWRDLSGNNLTGTPNSGVTYSNDNGGSLLFDGTSGNVSLVTYPSFSNAATFSAVVKKTESKDSCVVYAFKGCMLQFDNTSIQFWFDLSKGPISYSFTPTINQWYNITVTQEDLLNKIYIDNNLVKTTTTSDPLHSGFYVKKDLGFYNNSRYFLGQIAIVQTYNRALTPSEVSQNFNALRGRYGI